MAIWTILKGNLLGLVKSKYLLTLRLIYHRMTDDDNRKADGDRRTDRNRRIGSDRRINSVKRTNDNRGIDGYRKI